MSRKNILKYTIVENHPTETTFDSRSNPTNVDYQDNVGIAILSDPLLAIPGTFTIWASNDKAEELDSRLPENWFALDFGEPLHMYSETALFINLNQVPFSWIAVTYTPDVSPAAGSFTIKVTSKMIG